MAAIDRLSKLLNLAENAGTQAEAEAFFAKAQEVATLTQISLEQARAHAEAGRCREVPVHQQVPVGVARQHVNSHLCVLAAAIGEANSLRTNVASNNTFIIWFGLPGDIETAIMLLNAVGVQMVRSADAFLRSRRWVGETDLETGRAVTAQRARKAYYTAYVAAISARLVQARAAAVVRFDEGSSGQSGALVLRGKEVEVADYYAQHSTARGSWRGHRAGHGSRSAAATARADAAAARLGTSKSIGGTTPAVAS